MKRRKQYPRCIFCGAPVDEPNVEDVLPKWIAREFGKDAFFDATHGPLDQPPTKAFSTKNHLGWLVKGQCRRNCNNGWMSDLETIVKPVLTPLMRGTPSTIDESGATIIMHWLTKTALMWEYMRYFSGRYFREVDRHAFYRSRTLPGRTFIFAAAYSGPARVAVVGGPFGVAIRIFMVPTRVTPLH